jgi:hypothetical protein
VDDGAAPGAAGDAAEIAEAMSEEEVERELQESLLTSFLPLFDSMLSLTEAVRRRHAAPAAGQDTDQQPLMSESGQADSDTDNPGGGVVVRGGWKQQAKREHKRTHSTKKKQKKQKKAKQSKKAAESKPVSSSRKRSDKARSPRPAGAPASVRSPRPAGAQPRVEDDDESSSSSSDSSEAPLPLRSPLAEPRQPTRVQRSFVVSSFF